MQRETAESVNLMNKVYTRDAYLRGVEQAQAGKTGVYQDARKDKCIQNFSALIESLKGAKVSSVTMVESITATNTIYLTYPFGYKRKDIWGNDPTEKFSKVIMGYDPSTGKAIDAFELPEAFGVDIRESKVVQALDSLMIFIEGKQVRTLSIRNLRSA